MACVCASCGYSCQVDGHADDIRPVQIQPEMIAVLLLPTLTGPSCLGQSKPFPLVITNQSLLNQVILGLSVLYQTIMNYLPMGACGYSLAFGNNCEY